MEGQPRTRTRLVGKRPLSDDVDVTLQVEALAFAFNGTPILDGVSLRLDPGRIVGVIGPNGAGKSTLVRLMSRLLRPAEGRIMLNGLDLAHWRPEDTARVLAVVPQDANLPDTYTAWELVLMGRTPYLGWLGTESARDRAVARHAMEETGVWRLADRLVGQLSGGEQQRVVVARALAQEPRVLLLDEPTAHLDINHQMETLMLVKRLVAERRLAALAIFHDLNLAAQYCDELVLLDRGRIVAYGPPAEVLTPEAIASVYGAEVDIVAHPQNGLPIICPQFPSATTPS